MKNYNRVPSIKLNNQAALDYTLYMMTSSRFKRYEINSLILEEQLYHRYRELRPVERDILENICVGISDHYLLKVLPAYIWDCKVSVRLKKHPEDGFTSVIFDGSIFALEISARISGARRVLFSYDIPQVFVVKGTIMQTNMCCTIQRVRTTINITNDYYIFIKRRRVQQ